MNWPVPGPLRVWPVLGLLAIAAVFVAGRASGLPHAANENAWDIALPALTDTKISNVVVLGWWLITLLAPLPWIARPEALIRYGSRLTASLRAVGCLAAPLSAGTAAMAAASLLASQGGWSWAWSDAAVARSVGTETGAFTAEDLARWFDDPPLAAFATAAYGALFLLLLGLLAMTLAVTAGAGRAAVVLVAVFVWAALSSFGVFDGLPLLDASRLINLPWALHTGSAWALPLVAALVSVACVAALGAAGSRRRPRLRALLAGPWALGAVPLLAAVFAALDPGNTSRSLSENLVGFFGGTFADLPRYLAVMTLVLAAATGAASRLDQRATERYVCEAIRLGSPARWTSRVLAAELGRAVVLALTIPIACALAFLLFRPASVAGFGAALPVVLIVAGLLAVQLAMYVTVILAARWVTAAAGTWPIIAGLGLVFGYPLFIALGPVNVFAAFSIDGLPPAGVQTSALIATAAVTLGATVTALVVGAARRLPPHASKGPTDS
ncbi:MAG: hypothetical protein QM602_05860 [Microbacterium sp.]